MPLDDLKPRIEDAPLPGDVRSILREAERLGVESKRTLQVFDPKDHVTEFG